MPMVHVTQISNGKSSICRAILDDLPEWFGLPEAKETYITEADDLPMLACQDGQDDDGVPIGFISLKLHTSFAAELYVLGVKRRFHRRGVGRALIEAAVAQGTERGLRFLTVKTLAPTHPDPNYAATRRFYEAMNFVPVELFPTLWGPDNPCLLMARVI
jgi:ribosomal protein S18 acetylase RimI-like enzyme